VFEVVANGEGFFLGIVHCLLCGGKGTAPESRIVLCFGVVQMHKPFSAAQPAFGDVTVHVLDLLVVVGRGVSLPFHSFTSSVIGWISRETLPGVGAGKPG
jgi:hypothetical protein